MVAAAANYLWGGLRDLPGIVSPVRLKKKRGVSRAFIGRGGGIRTPDPLVPNQMRYQTALRPDSF